MTITDLAVRLTAMEQRLTAIEASVQRIGRRMTELDELEKVVGDLKLAIEEMQEA